MGEQRSEIASLTIDDTAVNFAISFGLQKDL